MYIKITLFVLCVFFSCSPTSRSNLAGSHLKTTVTKESKIVHETVEGRQLSIYLPPDYSKDRTYKVIYFHDGQELFVPDWDLQPLLDELIAQEKIEPLVVVGIHSTRERSSDLVPFEDDWIRREWGDYTPKATTFSEFIANKIQPFVQRNYQVSEALGDQALFGASFGGLHAIWDAAKQPDRWGMVAGISPSGWVADYELFKTVEKAKWKNTKLWLDIGTGEWEYYVPIVESLLEQGLDYGSELFYYEIPDARHIPKDWRARIAYPLIVFAGRQPYKPVSMKVEVEFIPSLSSNRMYRRINPVITCSNGIRFSAVTQASYILLNPEAGTIEKDGRFEFSGKKNLKVQVKYEAFEESLTIKFQK